MLPGDSYLHSVTPAECDDLDTLRSLLSVFDRSASGHSASSSPHESLGGPGSNGSDRGTSPPADSTGQPERDDTMRDDTLLSASELAAKYSQGPAAGAARGSSPSASLPAQPPLHPSLDLSDAVLLRFLRATHGDIHAAVDRWTTTFQWRLDFGVDALLDTWTPPRVLREYLPGGFCNLDRDGIRYSSIGQGKPTYTASFATSPLMTVSATRCGARSRPRASSRSYHAQTAPAAPTHRSPWSQTSKD